MFLTKAYRSRRTGVGHFHNLWERHVGGIIRHLTGVSSVINHTQNFVVKLRRRSKREIKMMESFMGALAGFATK